METQDPLEAFETATVHDVLVWCVGLLVHQARLHLGLVPEKGPKDLDQARLAIDAAGALVELLQGKVPAETFGELLMHIADLRLYYVRLQERPQRGP